jgi:NitT/TauT family transport system substrate-binding protein
MTLDPTLRPQLIDALHVARDVLVSLGTTGDYDQSAWVDDQYVRLAFAELGLQYQPDQPPKNEGTIKLAASGCKLTGAEASKTLQVWIADGKIETFSGLQCLGVRLRQIKGQANAIAAVYVTDRESKSETFGQFSFYVLTSGSSSDEIIAFNRRSAAEAEATRVQGTVVDFGGLISALSGETK